MDHIFHVGYHKTGTTWLQRNVFPQVEGATSLVDDPIANALVRQLVKEDRFYEEAYRAVLDANGRALVSYEGLVGRPWGPTDPERIADRLKAVAPEAKILILTRDMVGLRRSMYAQYVNSGGYLPPERLDEVINPGYFDMDRTIERFRSRFSDVLTLRYEDLRADPTKVLAAMGEFADVRLSAPPASTRNNVSLSGWELRALRVWNHYFRRTWLNPNPRFPVPKAGAMRVLMQKRAARRG